MDWVAIRAALHNWVVACTGLPANKVTWARQRSAPRPAEDGIVMKIYVVDDEGQSWIDVEDNPLEFDDLTITAVSGNNLSIADHELETGDGPVQLEGADLPQPIEEETNYWVIKIDDDTIRLAAQFEDTGGDTTPVGGGTGTNPITPITLTDAGSGVMTLRATSDTLRAGEEINFVQRGMVRATLQLFSYVQDDTGLDGAIATLRRVANRYRLPSNIEILQEANIGITRMERTRSMLGIRNSQLFEPRAWIDIDLSLVYEERENGTIIGRVSVEQEEPEPTWTEDVENENL